MSHLIGITYNFADKSIIMRSIFSFLAFLSFIILTQCSQDRSVSVVKVEGGKVAGVTEDGITVFKGIPFAAPPAGEMRWKPPQPVKRWKGVLKADKFGPACPQLQRTIQGSPPAETSEDCLYLNVWTPAQFSDEQLPVMVWIYGGGFAGGSTSIPLYSGEQLARMGVVVVSIAYRVGPLGFMAHPELTAESGHNSSGNYGLLDQIAGLNWVQKNIREFGGDPAKVTIFGESAGAVSVSILAASPLARGLFRGAISQSGGSFAPAGESRDNGNYMQVLKSAEKEGISFMERMGVHSIASLRRVEPEKWMKDPAAQMGFFWPVIDGYVIVDDQYKLYEAGRYNDVNVIIGTNSDEGSMFTRPMPPEQYFTSVRNRFGHLAERVLELYPLDSLSGSYQPLADLFREITFAWPSWVWASLQTKTGKSKVFMYYFDEFTPEPLFRGAPPARGAAHGMEIPYVFGHLEQNPAVEVTDEQKALSEIMMKYWTNFVKTGDPNGEGLPHWTAFRDGEEAVMYLRGYPHTGPVPNLDKLKLIDEFFAWKRNSGE